jgi:spore maturation protein A
LINVVWVVLLVGGLMVAAINGTVPEVTQSAILAAEKGVEVALGFVGIMTLWLGMARVAERSGLMQRLAGLLSPVLHRLFPELSPKDPALGNMSMNLVANMLGMSSAATPFGLKAMQDLKASQSPEEGARGTATAAMITFIALNTAAPNLIPAAVIALRVAAGSRAPADIVGPTILATTAAMVVAVSADRYYRWRQRNE